MTSNGQFSRGEVPFSPGLALPSSNLADGKETQTVECPLWVIRILSLIPVECPLLGVKQTLFWTHIFPKLDVAGQVSCIPQRGDQHDMFEAVLGGWLIGRVEKIG